MKTEFLRKPEWLRQSQACKKDFGKTASLLNKNSLNTICESGRCPNRNECWSHGTATFMIGGEVCTRACKFCNTLSGKPMSLDVDEPSRLAEAVLKLQLKYVVITSVTRDDLADGGLHHWEECVRAIKGVNKELNVEVLIPDFRGDKSAIDQMSSLDVAVIAHNIETVRRLSPYVRSVATYDGSMAVLQQITKNEKIAKSGLMLGLGESTEEVYTTLQDLLDVGCKIVTIGQYLRPSRKHLPVEKYYTPEEFEVIKSKAEAMGFRHVECGPFVRSSYNASKAMCK